MARKMTAREQLALAIHRIDVETTDWGGKPVAHFDDLSEIAKESYLRIADKGWEYIKGKTWLRRKS